MQSQSALSELSVVAIPSGLLFSHRRRERERGRPIQSDSRLRRKNKQGLEAIGKKEHLGESKTPARDTYLSNQVEYAKTLITYDFFSGN